MPGTDHIKHYSAADIQRYLDGSMLPAEMHELEMAALDDPFLADAIEGMQQPHANTPMPVEAQLADLRKQLAERVTPTEKRSAAPVIAFRWWQAAAAAAIVVIGIVAVYLSLNNSPVMQEQLAITTEKQVNNATPVIPPPAAAESARAPEVAASEKAAAPATSADSTVVGPKSNLSGTSPDEFANATRKLEYDRTPQRKEYRLQKPLKAAEKTSDAEFHYTIDEKAVGKLTESHYNVSPNSATSQPPLQPNLDYLRPVDSTRLLTDLSKNANFKTKALSNTASKPVNYEQIVIAKTHRDTTAVGFMSKPRELTMNRSRRELTERQAKKNPEALLSGYISGQVTNQSNAPISNALVRVEGKQDYYTDNRGYFKIPAKDSVVNVAVGYSGYYTQNIQLFNNSRDNNIALNQLGDKAPNPLLNGRVAGVAAEAKAADDGYSNNQAASALAVRSKQLASGAEPEYGWVKYQQYLAENVRIPASGTKGAGKVVVSFEVGKKGALSDFKIEESLGSAYDDEAIRLIKAGPSWKLLQGRKARATVVITF